MNNKDVVLEIEAYKKARLRDRDARLEAEKLLEDKTRALYTANKELEKKYRELERYSSELELFLSLSKFSEGALNFDKILQYFIDAVCKLEKWPAGHVYIPKQGANKELVSAGIWHMDDKEKYKELFEVTTAMNFKLGVGLPGIVVETGKPLYIENIEKDSRYLRTKVCQKVGIRGAFGIPLKCYDRVLALIEFFIPEGYRKNQRGIDLVLNFVHQLETFLEREESQEAARISNLKLQKALVEVQEMAHHDALTNLPNRRQFELTFKRDIETAKRYHKKLSLLYLDVDNFKSVNDRMGHDIGDLLLSEISIRLQASVRKGDFVARLGGDEFAIILSETGEESASIVAEKIIKHLNKPCAIAAHEIDISVSIGIASFSEGGLDFITLCKNADIAMYKAKELGKNNYQHYDVAIEGQYKKRLDIENNVGLALHKNEFFLVYQPIYNIDTQKIFGMEVLLRWKHPEYGLISPEEFIPIAEEKGTIVPIGEWILKTACQQYMEWYQELNIRSKLLVNISPRQLKDKSFFDNVLKILAETGMPYNSLEFEITETALMNNPEESEEILRKLQNLGIKIAIDDFGTGYSSLNRLKSLPISALKIDKSFIQDIGTQNNNDLIVKSIIALARELDLQAIAEGVEEKLQLDFLIKNECPEAQGYLFNYPLTKDDMKRVFLEAKDHN